MTTQTQSQNSLNLHVGKGRGWKDLFVVTFLVVVLGAFVAQIASTPKQAGSEPMTSAPAAITALG